MSQSPLSLTELLSCPDIYAGQTLSVRGFLYQTTEGSWILSTTPHLKTCCAGAPDRIHEQLLVSGQGLAGSSIGKAETVTGRVEVLGSARVQLLEASLAPASEGCPLCIGAGILLGVVVAAIMVVGMRKRR